MRQNRRPSYPIGRRSRQTAAVAAAEAEAEAEELPPR